MKFRFVIFSLAIFMLLSFGVLFAGTYTCGSAAPASPLDAVLFQFGNTLPNPSENSIEVVACDQVMMQPQLNVPTVDVGQEANLVMMVNLKSFNIAIPFPSKSVTLSATQTFDILSNPLDFSEASGMSFDVYYGYRNSNKELKYNAYEVTVTATTPAPIEPPVCEGLTESECASNENCKKDLDFFGVFKECLINCAQFDSQDSCNSAFDGETCSWTSSFSLCGVK